MPGLSIIVPHTLGQPAALARLQGVISQLKEKYQGQVEQVRENWSGEQLDFGFSVYGMGVEGRLSVAADQVRVDSKLPLAAMVFRGKIEQAIRDQLTSLLA
jgi:hypothetical protein